MNYRWIPAVLLAGLVGCGDDGPELAEVTGRVTVDDKSVPNATLLFVPEAKDGSPSYGTTDKDGNYMLGFTRDKTGAMLGKHTVEITVERLTADDLENMRAEGLEDVPDEVPEYVSIPEKYREPGTLTAEVEPGDNEINFDLESE